MADSSCKIGITIDLSFDDLMIDKDIAKLTKQILRCYTLNRRAIAPMQFSLTSFNGKSKTDMQKHNGYEHWDVCYFNKIEIIIQKYYTKIKICIMNNLHSNFFKIYIVGKILYRILSKCLSKRKNYISY